MPGCDEAVATEVRFVVLEVGDGEEGDLLLPLLRGECGSGAGGPHIAHKLETYGQASHHHEYDPPHPALERFGHGLWYAVHQTCLQPSRAVRH